MSVRVVGVNTPEIAAFLGGFPPFDARPRDAVAAVAAAAEARRYAAVENILVEDAQPAQHLFVVREGSVELLHEEEVVDILEPGESFGHPSLLTGMAPAFTVRAHEDTTCYLMPREAAMQVLGRPAGTGYVAATLRERLTRTGHTVHALPPVSTVSVGDLLRRAPVFCDGDTAISQAARVMTENGVSAILIREDWRITIVTDAQLRERVLAQELSPENTIAGVAPARQRRAPRIHTRLRSGKRACVRRLRRSRGQRCLLRAARFGRERRPRPVRIPAGREPGARAKPALAHVTAGMAACLRGVPRITRRVPPDPRNGRIRLPPRRG